MPSQELVREGFMPSREGINPSTTNYLDQRLDELRLDDKKGEVIWKTA